MEHYVEVAIKKLQEQKAVELVPIDNEDDEMEINDGSQLDKVKPKESKLQLTE